MITRKEYESAVKVINDYRDQLKIEHKEVSRKAFMLSIGGDGITALSKIGETSASVRLINVLKYGGYDYYKTTVYDLYKVPKNKLCKLSGFGRQSMNELENIYEEAGLR